MRHALMIGRLEEFKQMLIARGIGYWRIFSIFPAVALPTTTLCV